jgi:membrane carboxypeptidase/penicillin-binding protein PbpC
MDAAKYYEPGELPSPASFGAHHVRICRLSGLLASHDCPGVDEWVYPGTEPARSCDWHRAGGAVAWPAEYSEWIAQNPGNGESGMGVSADFRIVSPLDGDRYQIPPGTDPRYATIPLRAVGARADDPVRWWIDGRPAATTQWRLQPGAHEIRARGASGRSHEVTIHVR